MAVKKGLGRGLSALINDDSDDSNQKIEKIISNVSVDINKLAPNKNQPRKYFDNETLEQLAQSIRNYGVIQPIVVVEMENNKGFYQIIAGERRWRASRIAGLKEVPVVIKKYTQSEIIEIALIENIQRDDLNLVEQAECYRRLIDECFYNAEDIAEKVGKSKSSVHNVLTLNNLSEKVKELVRENLLSMGHCKVLLSVEDEGMQYIVADAIIEQEMSIKEATKFIEDMDKQKPVVKERPNKAHYEALEKNLHSILGTKVNIKNGDNKGKIEIIYTSDEQLDELLLKFGNLK